MSYGFVQVRVGFIDLTQKLNSTQLFWVNF
nr:MAG TPA: hypothetical protein [Caudoviricetes sp.]